MFLRSTNKWNAKKSGGRKPLRHLREIAEMLDISQPVLTRRFRDFKDTAPKPRIVTTSPKRTYYDVDEVIRWWAATEASLIEQSIGRKHDDQS